MNQQPASTAARMSAATVKPTSVKLPQTSRRQTIGTAIVVFYMSVTFVLTHVKLKGTILDHSNFPTEFQIVDKLYHFVAYFILMFLILFCFSPTTPTTASRRGGNRGRVGSAKRMLLWSCFIIAYGLFDELTQPFFGRRFEMLDLLANVVGISFAQAAFVAVDVLGIRRQLWEWD